MTQYSRGGERQPYQGYPYASPVVTDVAPPIEESIQTRSNREEKVPYQGFPCVNPVRTQARSLTVEDLAELAKWQNLPRRPLGTSYGGKGQTAGGERPGLQLTEESPALTSKSDLAVDSTPIVYIDIPQGSSGVTDRIQDDGGSGESSQNGPSRDKERPVVYIDIPESYGSEVSQINEEEEPAYVQETIFYDPFKERRIEMPQSDSEDSRSPESSRSWYKRPEPPRNLDIVSPGSSGFGSGSSSSSYTQNTYLSKETLVYGHTPTLRDEFSLSPLPVNDTPYPPPYEEIDQNAPETSPVTEQPRTQVITTPTAAESREQGARLVKTCQHCNATVTTLVIKENGLYTHLIVLLLLWLLPLIILYYMFGCCRYRNHYCPSCNKKIGYQNPRYCCSETFHDDG